MFTEKGFFESRKSEGRRDWREKCPKATGKPKGSGCDPNEGANAVAVLLTSEVIAAQEEREPVENSIPPRRQEKQLELVNTSG